MKKEKSDKQFFQGALLITLAGLISKILSAGYRIPLQNITGDVGFYIYQQIYPFLGMALMLGLYGFPSAISKLVAEQNETDDGQMPLSFYYPIFGLTSLFSISLVVAIYYCAPFIAQLMGDIQLIDPLRMTALPFLVIPLVSGLRGIFQGYNNMLPTASSQIMEQIVRVGFIIMTAIFIISNQKSLYMIGSGAALASFLGAICASVVLLLFWRKQKRQTTGFETRSIDWKRTVRVILVYGIVISINHMLLLLFQFADAFTLIPGLLKSDLVLLEAQTWKGIFDRGQPLVQLGIVIGSSLALALLPTITTQRLNSKPDQFYDYIKSSWKFSLYLSAGATAGLIALFPYVNILLFKDTSGTVTLQILSITIVLASLSITTATILQGLGYVYRTALFVLIGVGLKWVLNIYLVPYFGVVGASMATVTSAAVVFVFNLYQIKKTLPRLKLIDVPWLRFFLSISGMLTFIFGMNRYGYQLLQVQSRMDHLGFVLVIIIIGALIYLFLLIQLKAFTEKEIDIIPFGNFISQIMKGEKEKNGRKN
ncbi:MULTISPECIES: polysaccharide biosynthesis protein [Paraliobacillus]|uniref:putative polysaccharide biosynthesis protein n=1 Tax=Paraliobacillus TaxID=200903 RepID=UPI000DD2C738|nr:MULTISPECIES: polysaccharide biosynthesis protein [Paraliobacillus]